MKKALLIGINYVGSAEQLNGCVNDITNIQKFLIQNCGYTENNITVLTNNNASDKNIENAICNLTLGCKSGDSLFFHYSGHGASVPGSKVEKDGKDEAIIPNDYLTGGFITDDWLFTNLCMKVPQGASLWAFTDCCHSGTMFDLKYNWQYNPTYLKGTINKTVQYNSNDWTSNFNVSILSESKDTIGSVYLFSGCQDEQTSADACFFGQSQGAFSYCLLQFIQNNINTLKTKSLGDVLKEIDCRLAINGFSQKSQLSVGNVRDINNKFNP